MTEVMPLLTDVMNPQVDNGPIHKEYASGKMDVKKAWPTNFRNDPMILENAVPVGTISGRCQTSTPYQSL